MPTKPSNHVTRALSEARHTRPTLVLPEVDEEHVEALEALYPPRCYDHRSESLEDHIKYAGKAELVMELRADLEARRQLEVELAEDDDEEFPR
jgi:molybdopterin-guanine dinucleotide biosynthesis protein A